MTKTLTEQWRDGTLEQRYYYVKYFATVGKPFVEIELKNFLLDLSKVKDRDEIGERMNQDDIYLELQRLAKENNVELTDNAINIARFRARSGLPLDKCPCGPLDKERGCISNKCLEEIQMFGKCHCQAFKKKD